MQFLMRLVWAEEGADAAEYALLAAMIAVAIIAGATSYGTHLNNALDGVAGQVTGAGVPT